MTKPKPIRDDPHAGQLQVVVSFRYRPLTPPPNPTADAEWLRGLILALLADQFLPEEYADLTVHVRVIHG